jgi:hypothetical protein
MTLRAGLHAGEHDNQAAIAALQTAAAQTTSTRLRQAIGTQAQAIARRLIWAGPRGKSVPTATGLAADRLRVGPSSIGALGKCISGGCAASYP